MTIRLARLEAEQDRYESAIERLGFSSSIDPVIQRFARRSTRLDDVMKV